MVITYYIILQTYKKKFNLLFYLGKYIDIFIFD